MGTVGVVLDTNVLVSALGFGGPPLDVLERTFEDDVRLLASEATLEELERVMTYDHLPFTRADRTQYLALLRREADVLEPDDSVDNGGNGTCVRVPLSYDTPRCRRLLSSPGA